MIYFIYIYIYIYMIFGSRFHTKKMWYLFFSVWLISLNMMISSSIHFPANDNIILYGSIVLYVHHVFFIYASVNGHLGCSYNLAIVNSAAINMVQVSVSYADLVLDISYLDPISHLPWFRNFLCSSVTHRKAFCTLLCSRPTLLSYLIPSPLDHSRELIK
jgi:hypothetical protein